MIKVRDMWINEEDEYFKKIFTRTGDKFDANDLYEAMKYVLNFGVAVDVGAHYGSWTRILANKFKEVYAIEGKPENFNCLVKNTHSYDNINLINKALGDKFDMVDIGWLPDNKNAGKNSGGASVIGKGEIPMVTLDSLNLTSLDFLKIDIEGFEIYAMRGGINTILKYKPVIVIEDNIRNVQQGFNVGDNINFLKKLGAKHIKNFPSDNNIFIW